MIKTKGYKYKLEKTTNKIILFETKSKNWSNFLDKKNRLIKKILFERKINKYENKNKI